MKNSCSGFLVAKTGGRWHVEEKMANGGKRNKGRGGVGRTFVDVFGMEDHVPVPLPIELLFQQPLARQALGIIIIVAARSTRQVLGIPAARSTIELEKVGEEGARVVAVDEEVGAAHPRDEVLAPLHGLGLAVVAKEARLVADHDELLQQPPLAGLLFLEGIDDGLVLLPLLPRVVAASFSCRIEVEAFEGIEEETVLLLLHLHSHTSK